MPSIDQASNGVLWKDEPSLASLGGLLPQQEPEDYSWDFWGPAELAMIKKKKCKHRRWTFSPIQPDSCSGKESSRRRCTPGSFCMILSRYPLVPVLQCLGSCSILLKCLPGGSERSQVEVRQAAPASLRPDQGTSSRKTNQLRQFFTNLFANGLKLKVKDFPTKARKQIFDFLCRKRKISRKEEPSTCP